MIKYKLVLLTLIFLLSSCAKPEVKKEDKNLLSKALAQDQNNEAYVHAYKVIDFKFPQDHAAHDDFKTEWWYFTGNLFDELENRYGFQFTIFRNNLYPELQNLANWQRKNIYMGHMGLSDFKKSKFYSFEKFEREAIGLAGVKQEPLKVWLNHWYIKSQAQQDIFPLEIFAMEDGIGYKLILERVKNLVLQGDRGLSQKSKELGNASYYYSYTRLKAKGEVFIKDKTYKVQGLTWMDREWSTSALAEDQEGWDWFSLQLEDDSEMMIYQLRNKDGSIDEYSSGSYVDASGQKLSLVKEDFVLKALEYFDYQAHSYPIKWSLAIKKLDLDLVVEAKFKEQVHDFSIPYWEGAIDVSGSKEGYGYLEMTGY